MPCRVLRFVTRPALRAVVLTAAAVLLLASAAHAAQQLSYSRAKDAIQAKADRLAGQSTKVTMMVRTGARAYSGSAEWTRTDPTGCHGCGFDPVTSEFYDTPEKESCSVTVKARLQSSGRIVTATDTLICL